MVNPGHIRVLTAYTPSLPAHIRPLRRAPPKPPPGIPFFKDPGHTLPTKRLYRDLVRATLPDGFGVRGGLPAMYKSERAEALVKKRREKASRGKEQGDRPAGVDASSTLGESADTNHDSNRQASLSASTTMDNVGRSLDDTAGAGPSTLRSLLSTPPLSDEPISTSTSDLRPPTSPPPPSTPTPAAPNTSPEARLSAPANSSRPADLPWIRHKIRLSWRKQRRLTSPWQTRSFLSGQYALLLLLSSPSLPHLIAEINRLETLLHRAAVGAAERQRRKALKPDIRYRVQGSIIPPGPYNRALPRMRPQPVKVSMMIASRIAKKARRVKRRVAVMEEDGDMREEERFWRSLESERGGTADAGGEQSRQGAVRRDHRPTGGGSVRARENAGRDAREGRGGQGGNAWFGGWDEENKWVLKDLNDADRKERARLKSTVSVGLMRRVLRHKRGRLRWKMHRTREARRVEGNVPDKEGE